ncbi:DUF2752 domain-containing protein [Olivibacter sitiensis]|uniref:DUF2752 domain-containing protein n=1 Tax=Olivibacter sitiensis TaxID=376470 RepID=UPI00041A2923|nr:DUF2752 domain-containing protein [Olivibacter sitiensis]
MELATISTALDTATEWLSHHLLPCPFKYFTGHDCPGCGLQRSLLFLLKGDLANSFRLYPATIPLLLLAIFYLLRNWLKFDPQEKWGKVFAFSVGIFALGAYALKIYQGRWAL